MFGFLDAGVSVAYHVVTALAQFLTPAFGGLAAAAAIVAFTIAVRLLLLPLSYYALRGQVAQARLQPQLLELRRRYAGQPERLQRELSAFYQREGGGMLAGCLPLLAQLPFFSLMYRLFLSGSVAGHPNHLLTHSLLGAPLGAHWLGGAGPLSGQGLVFGGLFVLLAVAGLLSARLARRTAPAGAAGTAAAAMAGGGQNRVLAALVKVLPYSTVVVAMFVPLAAGLYLVTTTFWTLGERAVLLPRLQRAAGVTTARAGTAASSPTS
jgi:YidC/Oxa1 family membrane protein insertase